MHRTVDEASTDEHLLSLHWTATGGGKIAHRVQNYLDLSPAHFLWQLWASLSALIYWLWAPGWFAQKSISWSLLGPHGGRSSQDVVLLRVICEFVIPWQDAPLGLPHRHGQKPSSLCSCPELYSLALSTYRSLHRWILFFFFNLPRNVHFGLFKGTISFAGWLVKP